MLQQIMKLHPKSTSLHIGADEVYMLGLRDESKQWLSVPGQSVHQLFCSHVIKVAKSVQESSPNIKLIMWDDMLRLSSRTSCSFAGAKLAELIAKLTSLLEFTELRRFQNNMTLDAVESQVQEPSFLRFQQDC
ncbi:hypothetical protein cypCar_00021321 [Cyprinus carpio]|nr:hypothetical protein cypCar_00021321 [Cyprinus carpio]